MAAVAEILKNAAAAEAAKHYSEALQIIHKGMRQNQGNRELMIHHAGLLERVKNYPVALAQYQAVIKQSGGKAPAEVVLGLARCLVATSRYEQAQKLFLELKGKMPGNTDVLVGLAACARHKGALNEAETFVKEALKLNADCKPARHELAHIQIVNKSFEEALRTLEKNVLREDLHGDSLDLWMETLKGQKRDRYMQDKLEEMTKKYPKKVEFHFAYGVTANRAGQISLARPAFQKADKLHPNNPKIVYEMGVLERLAGKIDLSQELIGRALALRPDHPAGLRTYGVDYKYTYGDPIFTRLNTVAATMTTMTPMDQVQMHFALAKAFDDVDELETAYRHYAVGGDKKRKMESFNEQLNARMFKLMAQLINADVLSQPAQAGFDSEVPVFVLGMPRSGTSLLEQILSSHPDIFGAGELKVMTAVLENINIGGRRLRLGDVEPEFNYDQDAPWEMRGRRYVDRVVKLAAPESYKRIVDKMPGNFNFTGLIHLILPNAKIIHSQRNPIETCLSCYRIHFAEGQQWSYNLRELGRYYKRYWALMEHWRQAMPGVMFEAFYENTVDDVEGQARKVIDFLGLDWTDDCLKFYETDRPVKTASASQVRKPIYKTSVNRWKKYEKYLMPLLEELGDIPTQYEEMLEAARK